MWLFFSSVDLVLWPVVRTRVRTLLFGKSWCFFGEIFAFVEVVDAGDGDGTVSVSPHFRLIHTQAVVSAVEQALDLPIECIWVELHEVVYKIWLMTKASDACDAARVNIYTRTPAAVEHHTKPCGHDCCKDKQTLQSAYSCLVGH